LNCKNLIIRSLLDARVEGKNAAWDRTTQPKIGILRKVLHVEASTKPRVHKKTHEFLINMVFTVACPNFKKALKMAFNPSRVLYTMQASKGEPTPSLPSLHST
jgi:hypothetical protein